VLAGALRAAWTAALRRELRPTGNPAPVTTSKESSMNAIPRSLDDGQSRYGSAFERSLTPEALRERVPAVFAPAAYERLSGSYTFLPTAWVLEALGQAGFLPVEARQTKARARSLVHTRHLIRLRRRFETVALRQAVPELLLLNSHDGTSAYQLRVGLYRAVCTNGLVVSVGVFPMIRVLHRGEVLEEVVRGALEMSERFGLLATAVERMERTELDEGERLEFAAAALALRFPNAREGAMAPSQLLVPRRPEDTGRDLWTVFNVIQESVLAGGLVRRSATNRLVRTRRITAIGEDIRLNSALWDMAMARAD
jgi:hypothetical protein